MKSLLVVLLVIFLVLAFSPFSAKAWDVTASNSNIRDIPTIFDFMPFGVTCVETTNHVVIFDPTDPKWRLR